MGGVGWAAGRLFLFEQRCWSPNSQSPIPNPRPARPCRVSTGIPHRLRPYAGPSTTQLAPSRQAAAGERRKRTCVEATCHAAYHSAGRSSRRHHRACARVQREQQVHQRASHWERLSQDSRQAGRGRQAGKCGGSQRARFGGRQGGRETWRASQRRRLPALAPHAASLSAVRLKMDAPALQAGAGSRLFCLLGTPWPADR